jgi:hypothetical protein
MKILNDLANLADTVRWTIVWKIEDLKNAVLALIPSKKELIDNDYFIDEAPVKKTVKKSSKKKTKKSKK